MNWSQNEVAALKIYYPLHGPSWAGWEEVLPNRTLRAISRKANDLGVSFVQRQPVVRSKRHREYVRTSRTADPMEPYVLGRMSEGLPPSEIDREMHWPRGRTVQILTERWARLKGAK